VLLFLRDFSFPLSPSLSLSLALSVYLSLSVHSVVSLHIIRERISLAPLLHICISRAVCVYYIVVLCIRYDNDYRSAPEGTRARVSIPPVTLFSRIFFPHVLDFSYGYISPTRVAGTAICSGSNYTAHLYSVLIYAYIMIDIQYYIIILYDVCIGGFTLAHNIVGYVVYKTRVNYVKNVIIVLMRLIFNSKSLKSIPIRWYTHGEEHIILLTCLHWKEVNKLFL